MSHRYKFKASASELKKTDSIKFEAINRVCEILKGRVKSEEKIVTVVQLWNTPAFEKVQKELAQ